MDYLPPMDLTPPIIIKLMMASVLGGLVGLERQSQGKAAGLRTNMFICAGSALFTILSLEVAAVHGGDGTRIASQLIPGIGFIGAGSIIRSGASVHGVTTAATIFVMASIGMAVGSGFYWTATFATVTMLLALLILGWMERRFHLRLERMSYCLAGPEVETLINLLTEELATHDLTAEKMRLRRPDGEQHELRFELEATGAQHRGLVTRMKEAGLECRPTLAEEDRRR